MRSLFFISALFLSTAALAQQDLTLALQRGHVYYLTISTHSTFIESVNFTEDTTHQTDSAVLSFSVNHAMDSSWSMDLRYLHLSGITISRGVTTTYTPQKTNSTSLFNTLLHRAIGVPVPMVLDKYGLVRELNVNAILSAIYDSLALTPLLRKKVIEEGSKVMGSLVSKESFEGFTAIYPNHPIEVEESWTIQTPVKAELPLFSTLTYRLGRVVSEGFVLDGTGTMTAITKADSLSKVPSYSLEGPVNVSMLLDGKSRWIKAAALVSNLSGSVEIFEPTVKANLFHLLRLATHTTITGRIEEVATK